MKNSMLMILIFMQISLLASQLASSNTYENSLCYLSGAKYCGEYNFYNINNSIQLFGRNTGVEPDSIAEFYDRNGRLRRTVMYNHDHSIIRTYFRRNLKPELIISEKDGVLHGIRESYYYNGIIKDRMHYENGNPTGIWGEWDRKGRIVIETDFNSDTIITKYHDYKSRKHTMLIRYVDSETKKTIKKEKVVVQVLKIKTGEVH